MTCQKNLAWAVKKKKIPLVFIASAPALVVTVVKVCEQAYTNVINLDYMCVFEALWVRYAH